MTSSAPGFRLCVVCTGNICRSPIAESVLRRRINDAGLAHVVTVESAGTGPWHAGEPADRRAVDILGRHGYDARPHRARQFRRDWFDRVDLILASDRHNYRDLCRLAPDDETRAKIRMLRSYDPDAVAASDTDVPDPYYDDDSSFQQVLEMIENAASWLVDAVRLDLAHRLGENGGEPSRR